MMKEKKQQKLALAAIATLALIAFTNFPSWAKSQKKSQSSAAAAARMGAVPAPSPAPKPGRYDTKPGPAWRTVGGTVKSIQGDMYTVEDYEGNQVKFHVGHGTKHLRGNKKVGDSIRAEITRGGFANSIQ